jgi:tetratricopeptide (TPR) repeat protein
LGWSLAEAQNEIAGRLARILNLELVAAVARRIERQRPTDPNARDLEMRGWAAYYRPRTPAAMEESRKFFEQALAIDPQSVDAMTGVALNLLHFIAGGWSKSPREDEARAAQLLAGVLERDANHVMARVAMGLLRRSQNRLAEAQAELEMAVATDRNCAEALRLLATALLFLGEPKAAIPHLERAIRLNPRDPNLSGYLWPLGQCHLLLGQVDEAVAVLRKACATMPGDYFVHLNLAGALGLRGDLDEARAALAEAARILATAERPVIVTASAGRKAACYGSLTPQLLNRVAMSGLIRFAASMSCAPAAYHFSARILLPSASAARPPQKPARALSSGLRARARTRAR